MSKHTQSFKVYLLGLVDAAYPNADEDGKKKKTSKKKEEDSEEIKIPLGIVKYLQLANAGEE